MANPPLRKGVVHIGDVVDKWRSIGVAQCLQSDADVASFLVRCYEDLWKDQESAAVCVRCHTPLTLQCLKCSTIYTPHGITSVITDLIDTSSAIDMPSVVTSLISAPPASFSISYTCSSATSSTCDFSATSVTTCIRTAISSSICGLPAASSAMSISCGITSCTSSLPAISSAASCSITSSVCGLPAATSTASVPNVVISSISDTPGTCSGCTTKERTLTLVRCDGDSERLTKNDSADCERSTENLPENTSTSFPAVTCRPKIEDKSAGLNRPVTMVTDSADAKKPTTAADEDVSVSKQMRVANDVDEVNKMVADNANSTMICLAGCEVDNLKSVPSHFHEASPAQRVSDFRDGEKNGDDRDGDTDNQSHKKHLNYFKKVDSAAASCAEEKLTCLYVEKFQCIVCRECFIDIDQLTIHVQEHSSAMPYTCPMCGAAFWLPHILELHKKLQIQGHRKTEASQAHISSEQKCRSRGQLVCKKVQLIHRREDIQSEEDDGRCGRLQSSYHRKKDGKSEVMLSASSLQCGRRDAGGCEGDTNMELNLSCSLLESQPLHHAATTSSQTLSQLSTLPLPSEGNQEKDFGVQSIESVAVVSCAGQTLTTGRCVDPLGASTGWCGCQQCGQSFEFLENLVQHARCHYNQNGELSESGTSNGSNISAASDQVDNQQKMRDGRSKTLASETSSNVSNSVTAQSSIASVDNSSCVHSCKASSNEMFLGSMQLSETPSKVTVLGTRQSSRIYTNKTSCITEQSSETTSPSARRSPGNSSRTPPNKISSHIAQSSRIISKRKAAGTRLYVKDQLGHACDTCSTVFATYKELQQHRKMEHKELRKFMCGQCGKELCNLQTLTIHERTHTGAKPFHCPQCPSTFRSSSNLRAHLRTHSGHTPYLCPQCGRGFKEITHLKRHLVSHSGERPYRCQLCGKAYVHATSLKEHQLSHSPSPKMSVCHRCGKAFANAKNLKVHLKTHDGRKGGERRTEAQAGANRRLFTCPVCSATYQQASSLSRHKKLHQAVSGAPHACPDCGQNFRNRYDLGKHICTHSGQTHYHREQHQRAFCHMLGYEQHRLTNRDQNLQACIKGQADTLLLKHHISTKPHLCNKCPAAFFTGWTLRLHTRCHAGENAVKNAAVPLPSKKGVKPHICGQCGAAYLRPSSLVRHKRLHQTAEGSSPSTCYQCMHCRRSFGDSSHLKRHLLSHSGEKPYVCAACGKAYADSHTLKDHMLVHSGIRSFICEVCGKAFFNAKTLKEHSRSHSDRRPFQCSQCSAAYKHLSGLISHRRLHSGTRPFQCGDCDKTFKDYSCYKRHLLTHTHHKPHICSQCGKSYKDLRNLRHHQTRLHGHSA